MEHNEFVVDAVKKLADITRKIASITDGMKSNAESIDSIETVRKKTRHISIEIATTGPSIYCSIDSHEAIQKIVDIILEEKSARYDRLREEYSNLRAQLPDPE